MTKNEWRDIGKSRRQALSAAERDWQSQALVRMICADPRMIRAETVLLFLSFASEWNTDALIRAAWAEGKNRLPHPHAARSRDGSLPLHAPDTSCHHPRCAAGDPRRRRRAHRAHADRLLPRARAPLRSLRHPSRLRRWLLRPLPAKAFRELHHPGRRLRLPARR